MMETIKDSSPLAGRLLRWLKFHLAEFSTFAAAISYQLMIVFFPGILLVKALKDIFGIPNVARYQPVYSEIDMPGSIVTLVKGFLKSAKGLTGYDKSFATVFLFLLVLLGLSRLFAEYYKASLKILGRDPRLFKDRLIGGVAAALFVSVSIMVFLALNGTIFSYQPHILRDYGLTIEIVSALLSFALLVSSVAGLMRLVCDRDISRKAMCPATSTSRLKSSAACAFLMVLCAFSMVTRVLSPRRKPFGVRLTNTMFRALCS